MSRIPACVLASPCLLLAVAAVLAVSVSGAHADDEAGSSRALPDIDELWNYRDPAATEAAFRKLLPVARKAGRPDYLAILISQIARTRGLQKDFAGAHALLDEAAGLARPTDRLARARIAMERGRAHRSAGAPEKARPLFVQAWRLAHKAGADRFAIDAVHMLALVAEADEALAWNDFAIDLAEASDKPAARRWLPALYNNQGWTYHDRGDFQKALTLFEKGRDLRIALKGNAQGIRVARWCVGRALRSLQRLDEALAMQRKLLADYKAAEITEQGFVHEEIGECLWAQGKQAAARPFLATAHERLMKIDWMVREEAERLASLAKRARP